MTLDRRALLRLAAAGTVVPVLAACGSDDPSAQPSPSASGAGSASPTGEPALEDVGPGAAPTLQIGDAEAELIKGSSRYAFGLIEEGTGPVSDAEVTVHVGRDPTKRPDVTVKATALEEEVADRGLYVAQVPFPEAGDYFVAIVARTKENALLKGGTRVTVATASKSPLNGQKLKPIETPTTANRMGADPLCSRNPVCSMHAMSLADAAASGKPTVVVFAAPAFCRTQLCGPGVEIVQRVADRYRGKANFVHVEAFRQQGKVLAPALQAMNFTTEPWTYFIDAKGVVSDRISGAFATSEVEARLAKMGVR